jgi:transposase
MKSTVEKKEYDTTFIHMVLRELWSQDERDYNKLSAKFKISRYTIIQWQKKFWSESEMILSTDPVKILRYRSDDKEVQISKLERALEVCNIQIATLETMIDIAERTYKIKIRKKSGTQQ